MWIITRLLNSSTTQTKSPCKNAPDLISPRLYTGIGGNTSLFFPFLRNRTL
jgi:hypothetical protein